MQSSHLEPTFSIRLSDSSATSGDAIGQGYGRGFRDRRRNRHGRGLRGELLSPNLPGYLSRTDRFDELVMDSAQRLHDIWGKTLDGVRFAVDEIPPNLEFLVAEKGRAPLGAYIPGHDDDGPLITVYRRVAEHACDTREELQDLVHDVVVEYTAEMLGVAPETVDPVYRRRY